MKEILTYKELETVILNYEISSSWWACLVSNSYLQELTAKYFTWKTERKFKAYRKALKYREEHGYIIT